MHPFLQVFLTFRGKKWSHTQLVCNNLSRCLFFSSYCRFTSAHYENQEWIFHTGKKISLLNTSAYLHKRHRAIVHHTLEGKSIGSLIGVKLITAEGGANTFAPKCSATTAPIKIVNSNDGRCTFSMTRRIVPTFSIGNPISMHQRLCLFGVLVVKVISFIWGFGLVILLGLRLHRNAAASSPCNSTSMSWQWSNRLILLVLNLVVRSMLTVSLHCSVILS